MQVCVYEMREKELSTRSFEQQKLAILWQFPITALEGCLKQRRLIQQVWRQRKQSTSIYTCASVTHVYVHTNIYTYTHVPFKKHAAAFNGQSFKMKIKTWYGRVSSCKDFKLLKSYRTSMKSGICPLY